MTANFDRFLLIKIQDQDSEVFDELSYKYRERLMRAAFAMTKSESDADDLVQEAFVRAYGAAPKFEGKSAIYTWLYGIMRNIQLDRWRRKKLEPMLTDFSEFDIEDEIVAEEPTRIEVIKQEVCDLDEQASQVIRLHYFDELSVEDIAIKLDLAQGTVKSRLFHARKKLKGKKKLVDAMNKFHRRSSATNEE
jgi:RNA polymerase sigma-70 factor (ECF subfamily)